MSAMTDLWQAVSAGPALWTGLTLAAYMIALRIYKACGSSPLATPVVLAIVMVCLFLWLTGTPYETYFAGAQAVHMLLGPATVALAVPLYDQRQTLKENALPIACGLAAGGVVSMASAAAIGWALGADAQTVASLIPKGVTTPIAMGVAERLGGVPSLAAAFVAFAGVLGAVFGPGLMKLMRIRDEACQGFAMGLAGHGAATAQAFLISPKAGAYSGLAIGLTGVLTAVLAPLVAACFLP